MISALKGNLSIPILKTLRLGLVPPFYRAEKVRLSNLPKVIQDGDLSTSVTSMSSDFNSHAVSPTNLLLHPKCLLCGLIKSMFGQGSVFPSAVFPLKDMPLRRVKYPFHLFSMLLLPTWHHFPKALIISPPLGPI